MNRNILRLIADKLPFVVLQLLTFSYLVVIGVFLPVNDFKQLAMKLLIMSLGLIAAWKLHRFNKEKRQKSSLI